MSFRPKSPKPVRIDLFGDQVESIRRFDVESQRSVLKVEDCTLLPLTEYQKSRELLVELGELMRQADIPGRDLPPPGEPFPAGRRWSAMVRPRNALGFFPGRTARWWCGTSRSRSQAAAERFWKRLEQIERSPAYDPDRSFFRWEELQQQAAAVAADLIEGTGDRMGGRKVRDTSTFRRAPRWPSTATCR